jgi:hypothetical protein
MPPQREEAVGGDPWEHEQESPASRQNYLSMDQLDPHQSAPRVSVLRRESFIMEFATSKGPPQIVMLCMLLALGFGSTIGVVRTSDRSGGSVDSEKASKGDRTIRLYRHTVLSL